MCLPSRLAPGDTLAHTPAWTDGATLMKGLGLTSACVLLLATNAYAGKYNSVISIGDAMPSFDKLPAAAGGTLSSSELKEDVVVLVSLANHCPWVRGMDGDLVKLVDGLQ